MVFEDFDLNVDFYLIGQMKNSLNSTDGKGLSSEYFKSLISNNLVWKTKIIVMNTN